MHYALRAAIPIAVAVTFHPRLVRADEVVKLSMEEAERRAQKESPIVRRALQERLVVAADRPRAGQLFPANPWVAGTVGPRRDTSGSIPPATGLEWGLHAEQAVE